MRRAALPALLLLAAGFAATLWLDPWADQRVNDLFVYRSFAEPVLDGALPYRDAFFEYPPLAAPAILVPALAGTGEEAYRLGFAGWAFALAAVVVLLTGALAASTGGDRRRAMLAMAAAPLLCGALIRTHFDLAPVVLTLAALVMLVRDRPRAGLALLGAGAMTKGFPLVAVPVALAWLAGRGERRAALEGAAALLLVIAALAGVAVVLSADGAADAVRYHLERPVQVESVPAMTLNALDGVGLGEVRSVASHRADGLEHPAAGAVTALVLAAMLGVVALLSVAAYRQPDGRALVLAALAAVAAFAALGKVLSPQFLLWILPLGALAFAWRLHALAAGVAAATLLTFAEFPSRYFDLVAREPLPLVLVTVRDAVLLGTIALAIAALSRRAPAAARSRWPGRRTRPRPAPR
jgi:Glycosyltransferase family 87